MKTDEARSLLRNMFEAAIAAAQPALCVPPYLPVLPCGRLVVIGAGKASAAMAKAAEDHWSDPLEGLVVTRYGCAVPCQHIEIVEAAHPVPDAAGFAAAQRILDRVRGLSADDVVLAVPDLRRRLGPVAAARRRVNPGRQTGGETTVTVRGRGRGGRNVEFLLALAIALNGQPGVYALAGDTDGVGGQEEIAGAYLAMDTLARAWAQGIKPRESLADNDGHGFFQALGDSVVTSPTLTNVNDFRAILVTEREESSRVGS